MKKAEEERINAEARSLDIAAHIYTAGIYYGIRALYEQNKAICKVNIKSIQFTI